MYSECDHSAQRQKLLLFSSLVVMLFSIALYSWCHQPSPPDSLLSDSTGPATTAEREIVQNVQLANAVDQRNGADQLQSSLRLRKAKIKEKEGLEQGATQQTEGKKGSKKGK